MSRPRTTTEGGLAAPPAVGAGTGSAHGVFDQAAPHAVFISATARDVQHACATAGGLGAFLSPAEDQATERFTRQGDRLDYAASHALFRLLAARCLGRTAADARHLSVARLCVGCGSTEHGKPAIAGLSLSLSRSYGTVLAAAGPAQMPVGADIEQIPATVFNGFDQYVASTTERENLPADDVPARIRLWVAKEAIFKAAGLGLAVPPADVHLEQVNPGVALLRAHSPGQPRIDGLTAFPVAAPSGYLAALSVMPGVPVVELSLAALFDAVPTKPR